MKNFAEFSYVFFDLDGTLTDSAAGILNCLKYSLAKMGIEESDEARLRSFIGPSLKLTYQNVYGMSSAEAMQATEYYRQRFTSIGYKENRLFDGIAEMLVKLNQSGRNIVLATAKPTVQAEVILQHFQLAKLFAGIFGSNLDGTRENKDEIIDFAMRSLGVADKSRVVMIGDRQYDILGARKNGISAIGVLYGYGSGAEIAAASPDAAAESVQQLAKLLGL